MPILQVKVVYDLMKRFDAGILAALGTISSTFNENEKRGFSSLVPPIDYRPAMLAMVAGLIYAFGVVPMLCSIVFHLADPPVRANV